jgi:hypothetical protein
VAYLLKARTVAPEKQPLLANGSETTFVSTQIGRETNNGITSVSRQILDKRKLTQRKNGVFFAVRAVML